MFIFPLICSHVSEPCYIAFHDEEWGVPVHDDKYVGLLWCWHNLLFSLSFHVAIVSQCGNLVFVQETVWVAQLLWSLGGTLMAHHSWKKAAISVLIFSVINIICRHFSLTNLKILLIIFPLMCFYVVFNEFRWNCIVCRKCTKNLALNYNGCDASTTGKYFWTLIHVLFQEWMRKRQLYPEVLPAHCCQSSGYDP